MDSCTNDVNRMVIYIRTACKIEVKGYQGMEILKALRENVDKAMTTGEEFQVKLVKRFGVVKGLRAALTAIFAEFFIWSPFKVKSRKRFETKTSDLKRKKSGELSDILLKGKVWEEFGVERM